MTRPGRDSKSAETAIPTGRGHSRRQFLAALTASAVGAAVARSRRKRAKSRLPRWVGHVTERRG